MPLGGMSATQKILSRVTGRNVSVGEIILPEAELVTLHDWYLTHAARIMREFGVERPRYPERVAAFTDHEPIALSPQAAQRQAESRALARQWGLTHFYDAGRAGLGHIAGVELGLARPGMYAAGYDTHVNSYGALGCFAVAVLIEVSELLALGSVWLQTPETFRVNLHGRLAPRVSPRDLAQNLLLRVTADDFDDAVIEFRGAALSTLDIDARLTIVNTPTELGAKCGFVEPDDTTRAYCSARGISCDLAVASDDDIALRGEIDIVLDEIEPQIACPPSPENVKSVGALAGTKIQHAYIGSCASGTYEDLRLAAEILTGRAVHPDVRLFVTPATQEIAARAARTGVMERLLRAGAMITAPGCGVCAGGRVGAVTDGETSIGTGTRNDRGRIGADSAVLYLASPATVAASAITGHIVDPRTIKVEP